jgi:hypothetical protein
LAFSAPFVSLGATFAGSVFVSIFTFSVFGCFLGSFPSSFAILHLSSVLNDVTTRLDV